MKTPQPSAEAIMLAVRLSGHTSCQLALSGKFDALASQPVQPCDGCLGDAATIDRELQLPQRNAALLLAQTVVDAWERGRDFPQPDLLGALREALSKIKANP